MSLMMVCFDVANTDFMCIWSGLSCEVAMDRPESILHTAVQAIHRDSDLNSYLFEKTVLGILPPITSFLA
jgi:hypothetical protein